MRKLVVVQPPPGAHLSHEDAAHVRLQLAIAQATLATTPIDSIVVAAGWTVTVVEGDEILLRLAELDGQEA